MNHAGTEPENTGYQASAGILGRKVSKEIRGELLKADTLFYMLHGVLHSYTFVEQQETDTAGGIGGWRYRGIFMFR
ncbi:hypothetical protein GCM10007159_39080 [Modicisalibacter luteus]|nr:hypothetical protein GCM10007159_39080 [Halomonas lutea]